MRVYYAVANLDLESSNRRSFDGILYGGEVMVYNLYKLYICQFSRKSELFLNTKSALYEFIMSTLYVEFLPVIADFAAVLKALIETTEGTFEKFY